MEESLLRKENTQIQSERFKKLPDALEEFLKNHPEIKEIEICTDNDFAGRWDERTDRKNITRERIRLFAICRKKKGQIMQTLRKKKRQANKCRDRPLERR